LTVLAEAEAILNSLPIAPVSDDPTIGSPLLSAPDESLHNSAEEFEDFKLSYFTRWQRVTFIKQQFWRSWRRDYNHSLQARGK